MTAPITAVAPGGAAYCARVARIVDAAPPLTIEQRAAIRIAIWGGSRDRTEAAA